MDFNLHPLMAEIMRPRIHSSKCTTLTKTTGSILRDKHSLKSTLNT